MKLPRTQRAFTLIELLVVIGIIGILAALTVPALNHFKNADAMLSATRQMLDDVGRARQLAISQRTTVYMVFCPSNFWADPAFPPPSSPEYSKRTNLFDLQGIGYTFVTLRNIGDQPGRGTPRYLMPWRTLPENSFIPLDKFRLKSTQWYPITDLNSPTRYYKIYGFATTNGIPFPSEDTPASSNPNRPYALLPYVAFNYLGQLVSGQDEFIPLARGTVFEPKDANKVPIQGFPNFSEAPPGNSTNAYNIIHIDWLTGRARLEQPELQ